MLIRTEQVMDVPKIDAINRAAFDSATEAMSSMYCDRAWRTSFLLSRKKTVRSSVTSCFHRFS